MARRNVGWRVVATGESSGLGSSASRLFSRGGLEFGGVGNGSSGDMSGRATGITVVGEGTKSGAETGTTGRPGGERFGRDGCL